MPRNANCRFKTLNTLPLHTCTMYHFYAIITEILARLSHILAFNAEQYHEYVPLLVDFLMPIISTGKLCPPQGEVSLTMYSYATHYVFTCHSLCIHMSLWAQPERNKLNISLLCLTNLAESALCAELIRHLLHSFRQQRWGARAGAGPSLQNLCKKSPDGDPRSMENVECNDYFSAYVHILSCVSKSHANALGVFISVPR